jgi:aryl-alcohol dehydrogenase-like predicted oxidoreductase
MRAAVVRQTGDFYGMGHNEALVGQAIKGRRDEVFLSVKFGAMFSPSSQFLGHEGRPASVKKLRHLLAAAPGRGRHRPLPAEAA